MESLRRSHDGCQAGKLIWAGRAWARGGLSDNKADLEADLTAWGMDPTLLAARVAEDGIWVHHLDTFRAFLAVADQWRCVLADRMIWLGLDYGAVKAGLEMAGLALTPEAWADFQLIEAGAKAALNEA